MKGNIRPKSRRGLKAFFLAIMVLYAVLCLAPFLWAALVAMTPLTYVPAGAADDQAVGVDIMKWPPEIDLLGGKAFGAPLTFDNFAKIFILVPSLGRWFVNTVAFAGIVSAGVLFFNTLAAYAFARLKFPLRDFWFSLFLATMMVPFIVTMIPVYTLLTRMGWINTYQGLIVPKLINVSILFFMRQFFLDFPVSLEESAYMDGAGIPRIFAQIVLPNSGPAIAAQLIYVFLGAWNEFMWPLIVTSRQEMYTLTMGLSFFKASYYTFWQYLMAASLLITIPMIAIFLVFQRQFVSTNMGSAVKG